MHQEETSKQSTHFCSQKCLAGKKLALLIGLSSAPEQEPASVSPARAAAHMIHGKNVNDVTVCEKTLQYAWLQQLLHSNRLLSVN